MIVGWAAAIPFLHSLSAYNAASSSIVWTTQRPTTIVLVLGVLICLALITALERFVFLPCYRNLLALRHLGGEKAREVLSGLHRTSTGSSPTMARYRAWIERSYISRITTPEELLNNLGLGLHLTYSLDALGRVGDRSAIPAILKVISANPSSRGGPLGVAEPPRIG